jgi:hypothetical protein
MSKLSSSKMEMILVKQNEKSRHIGGKPGARDEAANLKNSKRGQAATGEKKGSAAKPKNADVGNLKKDR